MHKIILGLAATLVAANLSIAQGVMRGKVVENANGELQALPGATVNWSGTNKAAVADPEGEFQIDRIKTTDLLVISFVGYKPDTINTKGKEKIFVVLKNDNSIEEVEVLVERSSSYIDYMNPRNVQIISEKELFKAACCNLSESFETNPSVDVSFADAVTGTKQIQMLGLSGNYVQITSENYPDVRGLASNYGLTYTPGSWIQSIQVTKGIGSVVNGYESIVGQINVELKKPLNYDDLTDKDQKLFLNAYVNQGARTEINAIYNTKVSKNMGSATLLHGSIRPIALDMNGDSFADFPISQQFNFIQRFKYHNGRNMFQIGLKGLVDNKRGGQIRPTNSFDINIDQTRGQLFFKRGYVFPEKTYKSIGFITTANYLDIKSKFGNRTYDGRQLGLYSNLIYQTIIGNTDHKMKMGASFIMDDYDEQYLGVNNYNRLEVVPGVFGEYSWDHGERFNMVLGARIDQHNIIGLMFNPRLHAKYHINENTTLRITSGSGQRVANIFAENMAIFASARELVVQESNGDSRIYGLNPEKAWNHGVSFVRDFKINFHEGMFSLDLYRTDFEEQVVVDFDNNAQQLMIYNLNGASYSNSVQAELQYSPVKRMSTKIAYRFYDVKTQYLSGLLAKPFLATHRGFLNLGYTTRNKWSIDGTFILTGTQRLPNTQGNPVEYRRADYSETFLRINGQISKTFSKRFDAYVGVENLTNYRQQNPIVAADDPFGAYFDASMVWAPIFGRMFYLGVRYNVAPKLD